MNKPYWDNGPVQLYQADARSIPLADESVHCVVTSPPYYGLRVYKDNDDRGIGLESTVEDFIGNLVDVFREVRRVLRDDGVAWLNLGDSYASHDSGLGVGERGSETPTLQGDHQSRAVVDMTSGNLLGIPERVVLALQSDGWTWRDTIIWAKKSAMPESLAGWRWEQCRVKVAQGERASNNYQQGVGTKQGPGVASRNQREAYEHGDGGTKWTDCPGCPKCEANDGLILRKGSWRTTQAHEYIYMLTKGMGYYADGEAVKLKSLSHGPLTSMMDAKEPDGFSNRRSVWNDISPEPYGGSHFATFPSDLPRLCIQASTSERGCCSECGSQWARVIDHKNMEINRTDWGDKWLPTCKHNAPTIPATILDPFSGTATTCLAAQKLGRKAVGVDISEPYLEQAIRRLSAVPLPMGIG
jgi:DNA modification methylase